MLSGFLITGILIRARDDGGAYFKPFYMRRLLRIFPLYYFSLFLILVLLPLMGQDWTDRGWTYWLYVSNYGSFVYDSDPALTHFWSISVEEHFYLIWPLLIYLTPRHLLRHAMLAVVGLSLLARLGHSLHGGSPAMMWTATHTRLDALAIGGLIAVWLPGAREAQARKASALMLFGGLGALVVMGFRVGDWQGVVSQTVGFSAYAILYGGLLAASICAGENDLLHRLFASRLLRFFGRYSYAIYVIHTPVDYLLRDAGLFPADQPWLVGPTGPYTWALLSYAVVLIGLSTAGALATWHLFEKRLLRYKVHWPYGARPSGARPAGNPQP